MMKRVITVAYAVGSLATLVVASGAVAADAPTRCVTQQDDFDRHGPLTKAVLVGKEGARTQLYKKHPDECGTDSDPGCLGKVYLIPGDVVEVAGSCGGYAHVRYVGHSRTTTGWVAGTALSEKPEGATIDDPTQFMFKQPLEDDTDAGGFYSGTLADGTAFNANLFYASSAHGEKGRLRTGALWSTSEFDGRVIAIVVQPAAANSFSFRIKVQASDAPGGGSQEWWRTRAVSAASPASGFGNFQGPLRTVDESFTGQWSDDRQHAQGVRVDYISNTQQAFSMQRLFKYRRIAKLWPSFEDVKPAYAHFVATFPVLPDEDVQAQIIKDSANCPADSNCENEVTVVASANGQLTLRTWQFDKSQGGSAEYGANYSTYRVKNEHSMALPLDQVMSTAGDCGRRLEPTVANRLGALLDAANSRAAVPVGIFTDPLRSADGFIVSPRGITLHYQPASLNTSFAAGEFFITLTRAELAGCQIPG